MGYIKTKGIILKEVNTGEADKILTIFTKSHGRITGSAKGARRPKNKLSAGTQFLCYSDLVLFKGKDMYSISSIDIIEPFYKIRSDVYKLTYSAHIVDLILDVIQENQSATKVLQLFLNSLHMLANTDRNPELITRIFEIRFLSILGYAPYVKECMECGSQDLELNYLFSFKKCGVICSQCKVKDPYAMDISQGTFRALRHIIYSPLDELFSFELSQTVLNELAKLNRRYLRERLERDYTKLDFLKSL